MTTDYFLIYQTIVLCFCSTLAVGFIKTISGVVPYGSGHTVWRETGTLQECAELCLIYSSTCNSFDFCSGEVHCYTNTNRTVNRAPSSGDNVCDHYSSGYCYNFKIFSIQLGDSMYSLNYLIMSTNYFLKCRRDTNRERQFCCLYSSEFDVGAQFVVFDTFVCFEMVNHLVMILNTDRLGLLIRNI